MLNMVLDFLKKIFDFIYFFIVSFFNAMIPDYSSGKREYIEKIIKGQILYIKTDSLLREQPNSSSNIIIVLNKGSKVEYLNETITKDDGTRYDKVKIIKNKLYSSELIGFVLRTQLSDNIISEERNSISINSKTKMIKVAMNFLNLNTGYSMEIPKRSYGFFNKKYEDKYYFDCSSFCSCILNRTFDFPPSEDKDDKDNIKVWSTHMFIENFKKEENSLFNVVESINIQGKSIDLNKLQIGDFIVGEASYINNGINHMMFYAGEGYIIHCTHGRYLGIRTNQMRDGVVKERLTDMNYYTELESLQNIQNANITKRFDIGIYIIRYKEKKED